MILSLRCIYLKPKINDTAHFHTLEVQKSRNYCTVRLRCNRKLHEPTLCKIPPPADQNSCRTPEAVQCGWNPKPSRRSKVLHQYEHKDRGQESKPTILPHRLRQSQNNPQVPM